MELTLSENIRSFRKQRRLTQEQLAEVLGVTTGAVHKWEAGASVPELSLIVEMADFFDTSVDVLLGYRMKDNRLASTSERLLSYLRCGDPEALSEAEKALKKYPHSFEVVLHCALVYHIFGILSRDHAHLRRALELGEQALMLISQNTDPSISEYTIYRAMGEAYIAMGEQEKGLELLKKHNTENIFSDAIGTTLSVFMGRPDEAEPYLSKSLLHGMSLLVNAVWGYAVMYSARGEYQKESEIVSFAVALLHRLGPADTPSFLDKAHAIMLSLLAHASLQAGKPAEAREKLREAAEHVRRFDASPDYSIASLRFVRIPENVILYDALGVTARESVENMIHLLKMPALETMWKEVCGDA